MKYKAAKRVMQDHERAQRKVADIDKRRTDLAAESAPLVEDEQRVATAKEAADRSRAERDAMKIRHEEEMTLANARVYETAFAADQLAANLAEKHTSALSKRAALDSEERAAQAELAKIEKLIPEAQARLDKQKAAQAPCDECDGAKVVAAFCEDPKHDQNKPGVQNAGEQHACGLKIIPCPKCSAPKVVKIGTGRIKPSLLQHGGSTPRHPHLAIPRRTRGEPIIAPKK